MLDGLFAWAFEDQPTDGTRKVVATALSSCKDRRNSIVANSIPDHANAGEGFLYPSLRAGARQLRGTFPIPFGPVTRWDRYETDRVEPWEVVVAEDGGISVALLRWSSSPIELDDVDFFEVADAGGVRGQFARGVLREFNGVSVITMSFDRARDVLR